MWPGNVRIPLYMRLDASRPPPSTRNFKLSVWPLYPWITCLTSAAAHHRWFSFTLSVFIFNLYQTCRRWAGYFMPRMSRTSIFFCLYLDRVSLQQSVTTDSNCPANFLTVGTAKNQAVMWPHPLVYSHLETLSNADWLQWLELDVWPTSHILIFLLLCHMGWP